MTPPFLVSGDFIEVKTPSGKVERVPAYREDIARLLVRGHPPAPPKVLAHPVVPATPSPRRAAALARARQAVAAADQVVARMSPPMKGRPLTAAQVTSVNRLPNVVLLESVGSVVGRELAQRDRRLDAIEAELRKFAERTRVDVLARARRACMHAV